MLRRRFYMVVSLRPHDFRMPGPQPIAWVGFGAVAELPPNFDLHWQGPLDSFAIWQSRREDALTLKNACIPSGVSGSRSQNRRLPMRARTEAEKRATGLPASDADRFQVKLVRPQEALQVVAEAEGAPQGGACVLAGPARVTTWGHVSGSVVEMRYFRRPWRPDSYSMVMPGALVAARSL